MQGTSGGREGEGEGEGEGGDQIRRWVEVGRGAKLQLVRFKSIFIYSNYSHQGHQCTVLLLLSQDTSSDAIHLPEYIGLPQSTNLQPRPTNHQAREVRIYIYIYIYANNDL